jgi:hypothetical protein
MMEQARLLRHFPSTRTNRRYVGPYEENVDKNNAATTLAELNEKTKESNCVVMAPFGSEKL